MAGAANGKRPWIPFLLGIALAGLAIWFLVDHEGAFWADRSRSERGVASHPATPADDASTSAVRVPALRIAPGGRLVLDERSLPADGPLAVALELSDEARGDGPRSVRIVSTTAGRLDVEAVPLPGAGSGMRLEVERAFLAPGLYMIEVETVDHHPLALRRYVLEIQ
jgi:hypothetical protein